jgi:hypothetical protein
MLSELCNGVHAADDEHWHSYLENTKWFKHMHGLISGTRKIIELIEDAKTCLVHCRSVAFSCNFDGSMV